MEGLLGGSGSALGARGIRGSTDALRSRVAGLGRGPQSQGRGATGQWCCDGGPLCAEPEPRPLALALALLLTPSLNPTLYP